MRLGAGLVVAMGILALIASGAFDGLRGQVEAFSSGPSAGEPQRLASANVSGRAHVLDGDTIEVGGVRVRLEGLHCPEAGEPGGSAATSAMRGVARGQHISCSLTGERSYDRMIGTCYVGDTDLTAAIIRQAVCARCPRYDPGCVTFCPMPSGRLERNAATLLLKDRSLGARATGQSWT
jgi:endonuclease YncB( thermonuclease family)